MTSFAGTIFRERAFIKWFLRFHKNNLFSRNSLQDKHQSQGPCTMPFIITLQNTQMPGSFYFAQVEKISFSSPGGEKGSDERGGL